MEPCVDNGVADACQIASEFNGSAYRIDGARLVYEFGRAQVDLGMSKHRLEKLGRYLG